MGDLSHPIFRIDKHNLRFVFFRLGRRQVGETRDNHEVSLFGMVSGGTVDLNGTGISGGRDDVGLKAAAGGNVPDMDMFVGDQVGRLHQTAIDRTAPFVVEIGRGHTGPVDLGFEDRCEHMP